LSPAAPVIVATATPVALSHLVALLKAGRPDEAERQAQVQIAQEPDAVALWRLLAVAQSMQGKDPLLAWTRVAALAPDDAEAHNNLGNALARAGRWTEAVAHYGRAIALKPDFAEAHNHLGAALLDLGQPDEAEPHFQRAIALKPAYADAHANLGDALQKRDRQGEAVERYRIALRYDPQSAEGWVKLGDGLHALGRYDDAAASYGRALAINAQLVAAHINLGSALRALGRLDDAAASYRRALAIDPHLADAHGAFALTLRLQGRTAEAEGHCRAALAIKPDLAATLATFADCHADRGDFAEAETLYRRAIAAVPDSPEILAGFARLRKMTVGDADWMRLAQTLAEQPLIPRREVYLRFAIGKYLDDLGRYDEAFAQFKRANMLAKSFGPGHDRLALEQAVDRIVQGQDRAWFGRAGANASPSERPVFIVGMLRSGTSLAEQILASHPAAFGAGELAFWGAAAAERSADAAPTIDGLAKAYLDLLSGLNGDAARVIDKMPSNVMHLGLIHAVFPNARIIHMRRNPIDTCLSIYLQHFEATLAYANDLDDLAHAYGQYLRLMRHWRRTLPESAILDVPYEALVADQEGWSRRMVAFVGLPWDPACLTFDQTARTVITASKWQVRQKISASAVERWRNYAAFIEPLLGLPALDAEE